MTDHTEVEMLNETLKNIFCNFIPNRKTKCNYRQYQWMTKLNKTNKKKWSTLTKTHFKNSKTENNLDNLNIISKVCTKHAWEVSEKLNDCLTALKTFWKIVNRFINNINIPSIP